MEVCFKSRKSPWLVISILAGVLLEALAIGIAIANSNVNENHHLMPIAGGTALLGLMAFVLAHELSIHSNFLVMMDESGILDSRLGIGKIHWSDVDDVNLELNYGHQALGFRVRRSDLYLSRLNPSRRTQILARRKLGFQRFTIDLRGVEVDPVSLRAQISGMIRMHARPNQPSAEPPLSYV